MNEDYNYVLQQIARSSSEFQLDCCKSSAEVFWKRHGKDKASHDLYQNLLGYILLKL